MKKARLLASRHKNYFTVDYEIKATERGYASKQHAQRERTFQHIQTQADNEVISELACLSGWTLITGNCDVSHNPMWGFMLGIYCTVSHYAVKSVLSSCTLQNKSLKLCDATDWNGRFVLGAEERREAWEKKKKWQILNVPKIKMSVA